MIGDWLASLHTRRAAYRGISLALLGLAIFFAVRIGEMYTALLTRFGAGTAMWNVPILNVTLPAGAIGLFLVQATITIAFAYLGFYLSTHQAYVLEALQERVRKLAKERGMDPAQAARKAEGQFGWAIWLVIANDIASSVYVVFSGVPNLSIQRVSVDISLDIEMAAAIVAWTVIVILEFKLGPFLLALAESLPSERKQQLALEGIEQVQALKHKALGIVASEGRKRMDVNQAKQIIQRTAQRRIEEEDDPTMRDFLRELQDIALAPASALPALPEASVPGEEEPPNVITDGLLPSLSLSSPAKALPAGVYPASGEERETEREAVERSQVAAPVKQNGHAKGGQATERRPFRGLGRWPGHQAAEDDEDDDFKGWDQ